MGTFAVASIADYRLSFADQGKQTLVFRFRLQQTNGSFPIPVSDCRNKRKLPFSVSEDMKPFSVSFIFHLRRHEDMETRGYQTETETIYLNPLTVCSSCKRNCVVYAFIDKETNGPKMNGPKKNGQKKSGPKNGLNGLNTLNGVALLCIL
jgi:hypothetical protein